VTRCVTAQSWDKRVRSQRSRSACSEQKKHYQTRRRCTSVKFGQDEGPAATRRRNHHAGTGISSQTDRLIAPRIERVAASPRRIVRLLERGEVPTTLVSFGSVDRFGPEEPEPIPLGRTKNIPRDRYDGGISGRKLDPAQLRRLSHRSGCFPTQSYPSRRRCSIFCETILD